MADGGVLPEPESRRSVRPRHRGGAFAMRPPAGRARFSRRKVSSCVSLARLGAAGRKQIGSLLCANLYETGKASRSQDRLDAFSLPGPAGAMISAAGRPGLGAVRSALVRGAAPSLQPAAARSRASRSSQSRPNLAVNSSSVSKRWLHMTHSPTTWS